MYKNEVFGRIAACGMGFGSFWVRVWLMVIVLCGARLGLADVYLSKSEIAAIKSLVDAGKSPWSTAYGKMIANANEALSQVPLSVTFQGRSDRRYYTQSAYDWSNNLPSPCGSIVCDGQINPLADRGDYTAAINLGKSVRALGLGYAFSGNEAYAKKAIELINVWCVNASTQMIPELTTYTAIEQYITFPGLFYGGSLIWDYKGWDPAKRAGFADWARAYATHVASDPVPHIDNWESWRQVFVATAGAMLGDKTLLNEAFTSFKERSLKQYGADGSFRNELGRTLSLHYSTYALCAVTQVAEIARHNGVDLYSDPNLIKSWDFHAPYILNPSSWPYPQIKAYSYEGVAIYELAYARLQKTSYLNVINNRGRPLWEGRVMGPVTLTHAFLETAAPPEVSVVAAPVFTPAEGSYLLPQEVALSSPTEAASIHYTLDGSEPTGSSPQYTARIPVEKSLVIKAIGLKTGMAKSMVSSSRYVIGSIASGEDEWINHTIGTREGLFGLSFNVVPSVSGMDAVVGLSRGNAAAYSDLGVILRFAQDGRIDARNGMIYEAQSLCKYVPGALHTIELSVDTLSSRYTAIVKSGGVSYVIAKEYAFRTEQADVSNFDNIGLYASSGALKLDNVSSGWANTQVGLQTAGFVSTFDIRPMSDKLDAVVGLAYGLSSDYPDLAAIIRFNENGRIDVRNGGGYADDVAMVYAPGVTYRARVSVDLETRTYSVVISAGGVETPLATDYKFRTEQASVLGIDHLASYARNGSIEVSNLTIVEQLKAPSHLRVIE